MAIGPSSSIRMNSAVSALPAFAVESSSANFASAATPRTLTDDAQVIAGATASTALIAMASRTAGFFLIASPAGERRDHDLAERNAWRTNRRLNRKIFRAGWRRRTARRQNHEQRTHKMVETHAPSRLSGMMQAPQTSVKPWQVSPRARPSRRRWHRWPWSHPARRLAPCPDGRRPWRRRQPAPPWSPDRRP